MADTTVCSSEASSKSSEHRASLRKSNKPLMEKKRRARINTCLGQLKSLVLQALKKDTSQFSKLEKADILEMTVKHLKSVQQQHMSAAMATDPNVLTKYRAGFNECASEVMRYLGSVNGLTDDTRARVLNHLAVCMQSVSTAASVSLATQAAAANQTPVGGHTGTFGIPAPLFPAFSSQQPQPQCTQTVSTPSLNMSPGSNSLPNIQIPTPRIPQQLLQGKPDTACATSLQLIPGTLPSGQLAFFVASPTAIQTPIQAIPVYTTPSSGTPTPVSSPDISPATSERKPSISPTVNVISSSDSRDEPDSFDETNRSPERFPNNDGPVSLRFPPVSSSVICSPPPEPRSPGFITDSDSAKEADADADDEPDPQDEDKVWRPW